MPVDKLLVNEFVHKFFGFRNLKEKYWFIGKEEGGGNTRAEFENRIDAWVKLGKNTLVDVTKYPEIIGINIFFVEPVKLQST